MIPYVGYWLRKRGLQLRHRALGFVWPTQKTLKIHRETKTKIAGLCLSKIMIPYKVVVKMIHCTVWTLKEKLNTVSTIEILIH
jgi:hypothetical protein